MRCESRTAVRGRHMDALTDDKVSQGADQATPAGQKGAGRPKVLIIGGGFGGLFCARRLGRVDVDVTLLDRTACHVFQPLLYQCATGTLSIGQISRSLREELAGHRNVTTLLGEAVDLDADARRVTARRP